MSTFTQEQQTEIIKKARDLTATIMSEKNELKTLQSQSFKPVPDAPARRILPPPVKIQPQYPPAPKSDYSFTEHIKTYFKENTIIAVALLLFVAVILVVVVYLSYLKKLAELNEVLAQSPDYQKARAEAERIADEQQQKLEAEFKAEQDKADAEYKEKKAHYDNVILPEYKVELAQWESIQNRKIQIIKNELELNESALEQLYAETKLVSATYRALWILDWLYEDMNTSDHDIRYATELLDRDRQRLATTEAGRITQRAINNMNQTMMQGFSAVYNAIEDGNDIQEETMAILSKTRRDVNLGNIVGTVQRHNTNKILKGSK